MCSDRRRYHRRHLVLDGWLGKAAGRRQRVAVRGRGGGKGLTGVTTGRSVRRARRQRGSRTSGNSQSGGGGGGAGSGDNDPAAAVQQRQILASSRSDERLAALLHLATLRSMQLESWRLPPSMWTSSRTMPFWAKNLMSRTWKQESVSTSTCTTTLLKEYRKQSRALQLQFRPGASRASQQSQSSSSCSSSPFKDDCLHGVKSTIVAVSSAASLRYFRQLNFSRPELVDRRAAT